MIVLEKVGGQSVLLFVGCTASCWRVSDLI